MMGPEGYELLGGSRSHMWVVRRKVLHIQFSPDWRLPLGYFNDRSHVCIFTAPIVKPLTKYFLKYASRVLHHFLNKDKAPLYG